MKEYKSDLTQKIEAEMKLKWHYLMCTNSHCSCIPLFRFRLMRSGLFGSGVLTVIEQLDFKFTRTQLATQFGWTCLG